MVAANDEEGLLGLVAIEAGERGDDELVAATDLELVEGEQAAVAAHVLGFELIEDAVGDEHGLRVVEVEGCREGAYGRADTSEDEVDIAATVGAQQFETGAEVVDIIDQDAVQGRPQLLDPHSLRASAAICMAS